MHLALLKGLQLAIYVDLDRGNGTAVVGVGELPVPDRWDVALCVSVLVLILSSPVL